MCYYINKYGISSMVFILPEALEVFLGYMILYRGKLVWFHIDYGIKTCAIFTVAKNRFLFQVTYPFS